MEKKKMYRSSSNKVFAGVCGGLGEYFNFDPFVLRLALIIFVIFSNIYMRLELVQGLLVIYGLAILLVPRRPSPSVHIEPTEKK